MSIKLWTMGLLIALGATCGEVPPVVPKPVVPATTETQAAPVSKFGPRDIEIQLVDNSLFRGALEGVESLKLKTAYGVLTIPCSEILRIQRGQRLDEKTLKDLDATIQALDHDEFAKRTAAQQKLEAGNASVVEPLKKARETASAEARARIDKILAKLNEKLHGATVQVEDLVRTTRFECSGILQLEVLKMSSRVGQLAIKIDDLRTIRWLNHGESKSLNLDATPAMVEWLDTGVTLNNGDLVALQASGSINPAPNNNNLEIGPIGTENWGNQNTPFLMGALIGKVGVDGEAFLIGGGKSWTATAKDKLFVKVFWNNRQCRIEPAAKGSYKIKITTGTMAEGVKVLKAGQEEEGEAPEGLNIFNFKN